MTPEYRQGLGVFARNFFRALFERLKPPFVLIFDDYQHVADETLHAVLRTAVAELPVGGRIIFLSRDEPPAAFARLRAHQEFASVDGSALKFTVSEATHIVPKQLSRTAIQSLCERTDGWAAGLVLLTERLNTSAAASESIGAASPELLFAYFASEIFGRLNARLQKFLMRVSILPNIDVTVASALTRDRRAGDILARLQRRNYFIRRHAGAAPVYRHHDLFREFLLAEAQRRLGAARLKALRVRAAALMEAKGQIDAAAQMLLEAEHVDGLAKMIARYAGTYITQGRHQTVLAWMTAMPPHLIENQAWLLCWRGVCSLHERDGSRKNPSAQDFERALELFRRECDAVGVYFAWSWLIWSWAMTSDVQPMDRWLETFDELKSQFDIPSEDVEAWVAAGVATAVQFRKPKHPQAHYWVTRCLELAHRQSDPMIRSFLLSQPCLHFAEIGDFSRAKQATDVARHMAKAADLSEVQISVLNVGLCFGDLHTASSQDRRRTISDAISFVQAAGLRHSSALFITLVGATAALSDGDIATANRWLSDIERDLDVIGPGFLSWYRRCVMWRALLEGDLKRARQLQPEMLRMNIEDGWFLNEACARLLTAQVLHACGEQEEARSHIERGLEIAHETDSAYVEYMSRLVDAQLRLDDGDHTGGLQALRRAFAIGVAQDIYHSSAWQPSAVARLCIAALEANIEVSYVQRLIGMRVLSMESPPRDVETWPWEIRIFTLGRFVVLSHDERLEWKGKSPRKPLALLKAIVALGGHKVSETKLMDMLWPDLDGDGARVALRSAIHRLRNLLRSREVIVRESEAISLDPQRCWVDLWAMERLTARAEAMGCAGRDGEIQRLIARAEALNRGEFLPGDEGFPWPKRAVDKLMHRLRRQGARLDGHDS